MSWWPLLDEHSDLRVKPMFHVARSSGYEQYFSIRRLCFYVEVFCQIYLSASVTDDR
jgi:hypothetical protein